MGAQRALAQSRKGKFVVTMLRGKSGIGAQNRVVKAGTSNLWQSSRPDLYYVEGAYPAFMADAEGRFKANIVAFTTRPGPTTRFSRVVGGTAELVVTHAAAPLSRSSVAVYRAVLRREKNVAWNAAQFEALPVRDVRAELILPAEVGQVRNLANAVRVDLSPLGAQEWLYGIKSGSLVRGWMKLSYYYPYVLPVESIGVEAARGVLGRVAEFIGSYDGGVCYVTDAEIMRVWSMLVEEGLVRIVGISVGDVEWDEWNGLLDIVMDQARQYWADAFFAPVCGAVEQGSEADVRGELMYALKENNSFEFACPLLKAQDDGLVWLRRSTEISVMDLLANLDTSYMASVSLSDFS